MVPNKAHKNMISCIVCNTESISLLMIDQLNINVCKNCGGIFISDWNMILQLPMPLEVDNNMYAVAKAMAFLYKELESGSVPMPE